MRPDPTDPIALTQALIRCESVTPAEGGALGLLADVLAPAGFSIDRVTMREPGTPDVENLYAKRDAARGRTAPNLCFAGHTDVVPVGDAGAWSHPPFSGAIIEGFVFGRGAVDMKGAIACWVAAVHRVLARRPDLPIALSLLITGDEEGPSINGTSKVLDRLAERQERLDACLVGEPSNPRHLGEEIKIGRRGSLSGEIVVAGRQGHAAYPHLADNPIPKLARIIDRLSSLTLDLGTPDFEPSNLQVTVIGAPNAATNVIPAEARAKFNVRYNTVWTRPRLEAHLSDAISAAAAELSATARVTFSGTGDVFLTKPGPLVETLAAAVAAETGRRPALTTNGGTSDARFIQAVCPVVEFGLTNALAHHVDERVAVADLQRLTAIYERFIEAWAAAQG
jgi:succinyl-diaminopimelate desuccinylase